MPSAKAKPKTETESKHSTLFIVWIISVIRCTCQSNVPVIYLTWKMGGFKGEKLLTNHPESRSSFLYILVLLFNVFRLRYGMMLCIKPCASTEWATFKIHCFQNPQASLILRSPLFLLHPYLLLSRSHTPPAAYYILTVVAHFTAF